jgi:hypothetical protein
MAGMPGLSSGAGDGWPGPLSRLPGWTRWRACPLSRVLLPMEELGRSPSLARRSNTGERGLLGRESREDLLTNREIIGNLGRSPWPGHDKTLLMGPIRTGLLRDSKAA